MFFNTLSLDDCFEKKEVMHGWVGDIFKDTKEADALHAVSILLYKICKSHHTKEEACSSPYLKPLRQASAEAFKIFMENEKDNKEFCHYIKILQDERNQSNAVKT